MSDIVMTQIIAAAIGVVFTVIARLVDKYLPDPSGSHPLPEPPQVTTTVTKRVERPVDLPAETQTEASERTS